MPNILSDLAVGMRLPGHSEGRQRGVLQHWAQIPLEVMRQGLWRFRE